MVALDAFRKCKLPSSWEKEREEKERVFVEKL